IWSQGVGAYQQDSPEVMAGIYRFVPRCSPPPPRKKNRKKTKRNHPPPSPPPPSPEKPKRTTSSATTQPPTPTGREQEAGGEPRPLLADLPAERYAHSADDIDFGRLAGKRVGVLGGGASAFDNAAAALEAGATRVDLCFRRANMPRVNPLVWMNFAGMLGHFGELTDLERWRFMRHILGELPLPPPQDTFWRCRRFENFAWHADCAWHSVRDEGEAAKVETKAGTFTFDFIIFATGVETDLSARPELAPIVHQIALWRDRFTPPPGEESDVHARHPYLGTAFEYMEREHGTAPFLGRLHNFTFGATPSLGVTGLAIAGMTYGVRRLVNGLVRDLFREDAPAYYRNLLTYAVPEL